MASRNHLLDYQYGKKKKKQRSPAHEMYIMFLMQLAIQYQSSWTDVPWVGVATPLSPMNI